MGDAECGLNCKLFEFLSFLPDPSLLYFSSRKKEEEEVV